MIVMSQVLTEQGRGREDIQHAIRGSRQTNFRVAKNVVRYIRYRLAVRMRSQPQLQLQVSGKEVVSSRGEEDHLHMLLGVAKAQDHSTTPITLKSPIKLSNSASIKTEDTADDDSVVYSTESEVIAALVVASSDPAYSETYQRCCKVLVKIGNLSQAKHFFWEIDSVMFPDYHASVKRPMMIANVTANLVRQSYGSDSMGVAESFYRDMRQVALNCFAYNTEITAVHAQAQKMYQVIR